MGYHNRIIKYPKYLGIVPQGYAQLEYIQSKASSTSGPGSYIDTGIKAEKGIDWEVDFQIMNTVGWAGVIGCRLVGGGYRFWTIYNGANIEVGVGGDITSTRQCVKDQRYQQKFVTNIDGTWTSYFKNSQGEYTVDKTGTDTATPNLGNVFLFAIDYTQETYASMYSIDLIMYEAKLWQTIEGTKVLVRHFIPARRDSDRAIGMFDIINNVFYENSGTIDFEGGNVVVKEAIGVIGVKSDGAVIPNEYRRVSYIQSDSRVGKMNSVIDTGIQLDQDSKIQCQFNVLNDNGTFLYGSREGFKNKAIACFSGWAPFGNDDGQGYIGITNGTDVVLEQSQEGIYKYGQLQHEYSQQTFTTPLTCTIFNCQQGTSSGSYYKSTSAYARCYYFKIWKNGILVFHGIPVVRKSDSEIGMYDIIGKQFLTNVGTGEFLAGPIITQSSLRLIQNYTED